MVNGMYLVGVSCQPKNFTSIFFFIDRLASLWSFLCCLCKSAWILSCSFFQTCLKSSQKRNHTSKKSEGFVSSSFPFLGVYLKNLNISTYFSAFDSIQVSRFVSWLWAVSRNLTIFLWKGSFMSSWQLLEIFSTWFLTRFNFWSKFLHSVLSASKSTALALSRSPGSGTGKRDSGVPRCKSYLSMYVLKQIKCNKKRMDLNCSIDRKNEQGEVWHLE